MQLLAARVSNAVDTSASRLPVRELLPVYRIADIPDERAFFVGPVRIAAPVRLLSLQRRHHDVVVELHLDRIGVIRPFDNLYVHRVRRIGHVENRPAAMPFVTDVKVPTARDLPKRPLEGAAAAAPTTLAHPLHIAPLPRHRTRTGARGQPAK